VEIAMNVAPPAGIDIGRLIRQIPSQYPFVLVDRVLEHDPSGRLLALKNVTGSEEFFQGHFPGQPVMPGVLLMESLAQAAGLWLLHGSADATRLEVHLVGIDEAKFRRPVVPGDQLQLEVQVLHRRGSLCRVRGDVRSGPHRVAEARLLLQVRRLAQTIHQTSIVSPSARLAPGVHVGAYSVIGPGVEIGEGTIVHDHVVIDGATRIGRDNQLFPFCSVGLAPQDLKYHGEPTSLEIGDRNVVREFVTLNRGTAGGGGVTRIGDDNLFMAYAHVAHDSQVGNHTIFANAATLAGHVTVSDFATIGAFAAVHQFCRVGPHAFIGGFSVATKDVPPCSKTVGIRGRASVYGVNGVGLQRRGFSAETIAAVRQAYRVLLQSRLTPAAAVERLAQGPISPEVGIVVDFIRSTKRGVILRRRRRHNGSEEDEG
jgi:UDP-N-acetylglucosamine acyltransferase